MMPISLDFIQATAAIVSRLRSWAKRRMGRMGRMGLHMTSLGLQRDAAGVPRDAQECV